jgi:hypothetical protein
MATCKSCNGKVLRTDAFCGICGEPVPGVKPVVPISREPKLSGVQSAPDVQSARDPVSATFPPPAATGTVARAVAVVALSDPELVEPPVTDLNRTAIREREPQSEPAPVLPLRRKKNGAASERRDEAVAVEQQPEAPRVSVPDREASLPNVPVPPGPPILASDLLREQMRPSSPGEKALRRTTVALGAVGALGVLLLGGVHPLTFVSLALLIAMTTLALTPISYRGRAMALFLIGAIATGVALWQQTLQGMPPEGLILAGATILLGGSLLFRAYYRGARLARVVVTFGVLALGAWFFVSGGHESLVMLDGNWQSWSPAIAHMTFGLLALLSLMAFMDNSTRGGSHVWAVALLILYAVHSGLLVASEVWPVPPVQGSIEGPTMAAILTGVVGTVVAGMALAQVLVAAYQATSGRIKERVSVAS